MNAFIKASIEANKEVYEYINTHMSKTDYEYSTFIGEGGDLSLNIDLICEEIFIKYLLSYGSIYSEERGLIKSLEDYKIVIDPLDGSSNFKANIPYYGTSVALLKNNQNIASIICNLVNLELIYKYKNEEVTCINLLSGEKIDFFKNNENKIAIFERAYNYPKITNKLYESDIKFRSPGAVCLSLVNANNLSFVLFMGNVRRFDVEAALHICSNLHVFLCDDFLIVSKNEKTLFMIKEILKE